MPDLTNLLSAEAKAARLREIVLNADRKLRKNKRGRPPLAIIRASEIQRFFRYKYGEGGLPDDDAGREDLVILLHHIANKPNASLSALQHVASLWAPWMQPQHLRADMILASPRRWKADALASELGLTDEVRTKLKIRTIGATDVTKAERALRQRAKKRLRDRDRQRMKRLARGPQKANLSRSKPWEKEGISRTTYYRRQRRDGETKKSPNKQNFPPSEC